MRYESDWRMIWIWSAALAKQSCEILYPYDMPTSISKRWLVISNLQFPFSQSQTTACRRRMWRGRITHVDHCGLGLHHRSDCTQLCLHPAPRGRQWTPARQAHAWKYDRCQSQWYLRWVVCVCLLDRLSDCFVFRTNAYVLSLLL